MTYAAHIPVPGADGPIDTIVHIRFTSRLDRSGEWTIEISGSDHRSVLAQCRRQVELLRGITSEGAGIITKVTRTNDVQEPVQMVVSGLSLLAELNQRIVKRASSGVAAEGEGEPTKVAVLEAVSDIMAFAPDGWTIDTTAYPQTGATVFIEYAGEKVLDALGKLAEKTGEHFRQDGNARRIFWMGKARRQSRLRAQRDGIENAEVCLISGAVRVTESSDATVTRIYPFGRGNGGEQETIEGSTYTLPTGYSSGSVVVEGQTYWYIRHDASEPTDNAIIEVQESYSDISDATMLAQACVEDLQTRIGIKHDYDLTVTNVNLPLYPGDTIHVLDRVTTGDGFRSFNLDDDLVVLETAVEITSPDDRTVSLTVSDVPTWSKTSDEDVVAGLITQVNELKRYDQPVARASYAGTVGDTDVARQSQVNIFSAGNVFSRGVSNVTGAATILGTASVILANPSAGAFALTLPDATVYTRRELTVKRIGSNTNSVTVSPPSGQNLDGVTSGKVLTAWESITVQSNGQNWFITGRYLP